MSRFLSIALLTQLTIALNQLVLLPIQKRFWAPESVEVWLATLALCSFVGLGDFGLRNALFAGIATNEPPSRIRSLWSLTRIAILGVAGLVFAVGTIAIDPAPGLNTRLLLGVFIATSIIEAAFYVRISVAEAMGGIIPSEIVFCLFAVSRLVVPPFLIAFGHAQAVELALFWLASAAVAYVVQGFITSARTKAPTLAPVWVTDWGRLATDAGQSILLPLSQWTQLQLPIVVLQKFAPAEVVTAFVPIRVLFGLVRAAVQQVSRIASVQVATISEQQSKEAGSAFLFAVCGLAAWFAAFVSVGVIAENLRVTGPWFHITPGPLPSAFVLCFAFSAVLGVHQIASLTEARQGRFASAGFAAGIYALINASACALAWATSSAVVLAVGLVVADAVMLIAILWPQRERARAASPTVVARFMATMLIQLAMVAAAWVVSMRLELFGHSDGRWDHATVPIAVGVALAAGAGLASWALLGKQIRKAAPPPATAPQEG